MTDVKELPTVHDLRAYLRLNGWAEQSPGRSVQCGREPKRDLVFPTSRTQR
jgi:hypothetical protein